MQMTGPYFSENKPEKMRMKAVFLKKKKGQPLIIQLKRMYLHRIINLHFKFVQCIYTKDITYLF